MILLSSLCYGAAISIFFAALSSYITYRIVIKNCDKSDEYVKKIAGWRVDEVLNKWLDDCKIYDKLNFLETSRKNLKQVVDQNVVDIESIKRSVVDNLKKTADSTENLNASVKLVLNKYHELENKLSKMRVIFD